MHPFQSADYYSSNLGTHLDSLRTLEADTLLHGFTTVFIHQDMISAVQTIRRSLPKSPKAAFRPKDCSRTSVGGNDSTYVALSLDLRFSYLLVAKMRASLEYCPYLISYLYHEHQHHPAFFELSALIT